MLFSRSKSLFADAFDAFHTGFFIVVLVRARTRTPRPSYLPVLDCNSLMLRSIAIWQRNRWVSAFFILIGLGLWGIQMHGVTTVRAHWEPVLNACSVDAVTGVYLSLVYLYTMFTDLTVLIVTLAGLSWSPGRSGLWRMLWDQGIMFFMIAFIANLIPAVMLLVNLNPVINIMFSIPAIAATATCACRCFVGLSEYARRGDDMSAALGTNAHSNGWSHRIQGPSKLGSTVQFRRERHQDGAEDSPVNRFHGGGSAFGGPFEPKQTDTIDVILRSLSFSGPPGQRYVDRRYDNADDDGYAGIDEVATPVKYERGSDDTLSFSPLDTSAAALRHSRSAQPIGGATGAVAPQPPMMAVRRGSVPIIASPSPAPIQESRRPSAATTDIQHARMRSQRRADDNV
ncbi:SubName: Full=Uncharacterized protein {ECO:0000313/EMBL:CCA70007.1} [Serendipita indica DSM 11827]|nr:SubName: Full=Uncharacterized protein {ECO:0000313/EMBL:CCA70007.1} [Serendipita indica DSM 11827]